MKTLLRSIGALLFLVVMASLVYDKVGLLFQDIDTIGWAILIVGGLVVIGLAIAVESLILQTGLKWLNQSEELRQYVIIFSLFILIALILYFTWPIIGGLLAPHFVPQRLM